MESNILPDRWQRVCADAVALPQKGSIVSGPFGSNIGKRFFVESGIPVIRGNNLTLGVTEFIDEGFVFITQEKAHELRGCGAIAGDIIFTAAGTLGQVGRIPDDAKFPLYIISNKQLRLRPDPSVAHSKYLYYWFSAPWMRMHIQNRNTGASIPLITLSTLRNLPVNLPPLSTQRRIADILSAYDDLIENNLRRIRILEEMARSIYREWFVNFRFPGHEKYSLVDSALGQIPEGWEVHSLADLMEIRGGSQPPKSDFVYEERIGYVRLIQIRDYESDRHLTFVPESPKLRLCERQDVMIARYGASVARVCSGLKGAYNVALTKVSPAIPNSREFLRQFLSDDEFQKLLIGMSGRAAQNGFNKRDIAAIKLAFPSNSRLVERFERFAASIRDVVLRYRDQILNLRRARDLLLPRLLSGTFNLSEAADPISFGSEPETSGDLMAETKKHSGTATPSSQEPPLSETALSAASSAMNPDRLPPNDHDNQSEAGYEPPPAIDQTDRFEVLAVIRQIFSDGQTRTRENAIRDVAQVLGYGRIGHRIQEVLQTDLLTAVRRGILENVKGELQLLFRSIVDYDRDFLKQQFLAAVGRSWIERDEAIQHFCRWMGFRRTGPIIDETARSLIQGLLRESRLEAYGPNLIRRSS